MAGALRHGGGKVLETSTTARRTSSIRENRGKGDISLPRIEVWGFRGQPSSSSARKRAGAREIGDLLSSSRTFSPRDRNHLSLLATTHQQLRPWATSLMFAPAVALFQRSLNLQIYAPSYVRTLTFSFLFYYFFLPSSVYLSKQPRVIFFFFLFLSKSHLVLTLEVWELCSVQNVRRCWPLIFVVGMHFPFISFEQVEWF